MKYYSAIKNNTFESVLMRWMILEPIIQSEVSQKEKHKYSILMHIYRRPPPGAAPAPRRRACATAPTTEHGGRRWCSSRPHSRDFRAACVDDVDAARHAGIEGVDGAQDLEGLLGIGDGGLAERRRVGAGVALGVAPRDPRRQSRAAPRDP